MKLFIDTAEISDIKKFNDMGIIDGCTTNPSLILKSGRNPEEVLKEIFKIVKGPISVETVKEDAKGMFADAKAFHKKYGEWTAVKIPMTAEGLKAIRLCAKAGIKTNCTLVFSANQALLAAKAGATYVSPFIGRLDDAGHDGMEIIQQITAIYDNYGFKTEIIVASVRNPLHVLDAAMMGAHIATIPPKVLDLLYKHPLTDVGIKKFLDDWKKVKK
ncbi:MAG: fructose-6-phosphate aldolase [Nanoarchaeota archaeon]|nr:fructose-6-phosphate aldolase [Nanoarchaeota archaeon]